MGHLQNLEQNLFLPAHLNSCAACSQADALHHYGVAAASCAQVKGLGMMDRVAAATVAPAAEIFAAGEAGFAVLRI